MLFWLLIELLLLVIYIVQGYSETLVIFIFFHSGLLNFQLVLDFSSRVF